MSAKEEMVVEIEMAKEKINEAITVMDGVISKIDETQTTVSAVMGEEDPNFAGAKNLLEEAKNVLFGVASDQLDDAIASVNMAGLQS